MFIDFVVSLSSSKHLCPTYTYPWCYYRVGNSNNKWIL